MVSFFSTHGFPSCCLPSKGAGPETASAAGCTHHFGSRAAGSILFPRPHVVAEEAEPFGSRRAATSQPQLVSLEKGLWWKASHLPHSP